MSNSIEETPVITVDQCFADIIESLNPEYFRIEKKHEWRCIFVILNRDYIQTGDTADEAFIYCLIEYSMSVIFNINLQLMFLEMMS